MQAKGLTPILNVSNIQESFAWFEKLGWQKGWEWGDPPGFGGVCSGKSEIFLCEGAQGGRGRGTNTTTFGPDGDECGDKGVWMSIWVDDVGAIHQRCVEQRIDITWPPTDMPAVAEWPVVLSSSLIFSTTTVPTFLRSSL